MSSANLGPPGRDRPASLRMAEPINPRKGSVCVGGWRLGAVDVAFFLGGCWGAWKCVFLCVGDSIHGWVDASKVPRSHPHHNQYSSSSGPPLSKVTIIIVRSHHHHRQKSSSSSSEVIIISISIRSHCHQWSSQVVIIGITSSHHCHQNQ